LAQSEEERLRDQREKEELEQHLRERDTARTRKVCLICYVHRKDPVFSSSYVFPLHTSQGTSYPFSSWHLVLA